MFVRMRARAVLACLALAALPGTASGGTRLEPTAEAGRDLHVVVRNTGDETAHAVVPRLVYQHRTAEGDAVTLEPDAAHEWHLPLPPAPGPGAFPATVRVGYVDGFGRPGSVPLVVLIASAGAAAAPSVQAALDVGPLAGVAHGKLLLDNRGPRPVAGRVVFVLPGGMSTEPESLPAQVAAGSRTIVPLAIETRGPVPPGRHAVYAVFEYAEDGEHVTVVATTDVASTAGRGPRARPLLVGFGALALTLTLLAVAWRRAARRGQA